MIKMLMHGCNGAMGQVIAQIAEQDPEITIVAGVDIHTQKKNDFPVYASLEGYCRFCFGKGCGRAISLLQNKEGSGCLVYDRA